MNKLFLTLMPMLFANAKPDSFSTSYINSFQDTVTTITVFGDKDYRLSLNIFNKDFDWITNNSTLTLTKKENG